MKIKRIVIISILASINLIGASSFISQIGGVYPDWGVIAIPTSDGNYLIGGNSINSSSYSHWIIIKINGRGDEILWAKAFAYVEDSLCSLIEDSYGNYVAVGRRGIYASILKLDPEGNILWQKSIVLPPYSAYTSIIESPTGYILSGWTTNYNEQTFLLLSSFSYDGQHLYTKEFHINYGWGWSCGEPMHHNWEVISTQDCGLAVLAGSSHSFQDTSGHVIFLPHFYLAKLDSYGNLEWFGEWSYDYLYEPDPQKLIQTEAEEYLALVNAKEGYYFEDVLTIIKFDINGNPLWCKEIYGAYGLGMVEKNGNYIISAIINDNLCLLKVNQNGNILWTKQIPYGVGKMVRTGDNGFITTSKYGGEITVTKFDENDNTCQQVPVSSPQLNNSSIYLYDSQIEIIIDNVSIDSSGFSSTTPLLNLNIICATSAGESNQAENIEPLFIKLPIFFDPNKLFLNSFDQTKNLRISIFNVSGKRVFSKIYPFKFSITVSDENLEKLPAGIYFLNICSGNKSIKKLNCLKIIEK